MTNRELVKTGLLTNGALFLIAIVTTAGTLLPTLGKQRPADSIQWVKFDADFFELSGLPASEVANAPVIVLNKQAQKFVADYTRKNSATLEMIRDKRSQAFFPMMDSIFQKYNLPKELKYLAVVESELNRKAVSKVGAVGTWQLMAGTARLLSLKVTKRVDDRTNVYKSTVAAARYLNDLHDQFDDWLLVIAAYNSGPAPVLKAIKRSGSRNFWKLQYHLPAETRGHVKRFIGTHYFFEGEGGVTTLTKAERDAYTKKMIAFVAAQNSLIEQRMLAKNNLPLPEDQPSGNTDKINDIRSNTAGVRSSEEED